MLGAVVLALLGVAGAMVGDDDPVSEVASATTIRTAPESTTTTTSTTTSTSTTSTTSSTTSTTMPVRRVEPISLSGTGDAVELFEVPLTDSYVATLTHAGESNFIVSALDRDGDRVDGLANEVGNYRGQVPVNFLVGDRFSILEVQADGPWTMELEPLLPWASGVEVSAGSNPGEAYAGGGDRLFTFVPDGVRIVRFACGDCDSNVIVHAYGAGQTGLVNEIGPYDGEIVVPADTLVIQVEAQNSSGTGGNWTWEVQVAP